MNIFAPQLISDTYSSLSRRERVVDAEHRRFAGNTEPLAWFYCDKDE